MVVHEWSDGQRSMIPFRFIGDDLVIIFGDGDLSFSRALTTLLAGGNLDNLVSTVFEDEITLSERHQNAADNVVSVIEAGAKVLYGVDATRITTKGLMAKLAANFTTAKGIRIGRIVFNFPHTGAGIKDRDLNIRAQQKLILSFLNNAANLLESQTTPIGEKGKATVVKRKTIMALPLDGEHQEQVNLFDGANYFGDRDYTLQPEIHLTIWEGDPYDDWNIKQLAQSTQKLKLLESFSFNPERYPGYEHCKTIGGTLVDGGDSHLHPGSLDEHAKNKPSRTYIFTLK